MLLPQEIENCLHRAECREGDLDKDGVPVTHGAVPEAWEFQGQELSSVLRFCGDKTRVRVDKGIQVKGISAIVPQAANEVDWIEVGGRLPQQELLARVPIHLR